MVAGLVAAVASALHASAGIGYGLVLGSALIYLAPDQIPGAVVLSAMILLAEMMRHNRAHLDGRMLKWLLAGSLPGLVVGTLLLRVASGPVFTLLFAVMILIAVGLSLADWHLRSTPRNLAIAAALSGVMNMTAAIPGPAVALAVQREAGPKIRAVLAAFFFINGLIMVGPLWWAGRLDGSHVLTALILAPGVVAGLLVAPRLSRWMDRGRTRGVLLTVCAVTAVLALVRALLAFFPQTD